MLFQNLHKKRKFAKNRSKQKPKKDRNVLDNIHIFENGENDNEMALEEIFEMTPQLKYVSIDNSNLKMSNTLSKLEFTQKLIYFSIGKCSVFFPIIFEFTFDKTLKKDFEETIKNFVNDWKPSDGKPKIRIW